MTRRDEPGASGQGPHVALARVFVPVEPEPCRAACVIAVDSPVAVSCDGGNDGKSARVLVIMLILHPYAALVDDLNPRIVTGVERRPHGERPSGAAGSAVQDGVSH